MGLADVLLSHLRDARDRLAAMPALEERLAEHLAEARRAWPTLPVTDEQFLHYLAKVLEDDPSAADTLVSLHAADLMFACGCAAGAPAALEEVERRFMPRAAAYFARNRALAPQAEELLQRFRIHLLVPEGADRPRIAWYSGRAPFGGWFRIVVGRFAISASRARKVDLTTGAHDLLASVDDDPEVKYLRTHHLADLDAALTDTLASLPAETATLLRLAYLDGVPAEAIAGLYGVTMRTVQRRIADARARILRETEARLGEKLKLSISQTGTLIGLMCSRIDVSLHRFLAARQD